MTTSLTRRATAVSGALLATAALTLAAPLAASAHVHVEPGQASAGSYTTLTFKVPNESATASTTSVTVDLPTDTPFTSVSYLPVPGWTTTVTTAALPAQVTVGDATITEAPVSVTWTAVDGVGITDGQFQEFPISAGPVPETGSVELPAHQSYSDGTVVDWAEATPASGEEPEHPAPTLYIEDAPPASEDAGMAAGSGSGAEMTVASASDSDAATAAADASTSASLAVGLGIGGFALGAIALVVAAVALLRRPASREAGR
ncbi:YcnI family protein [Herbiconiux solani]|uniref:YcnI family protein n=1 Tax=Herbiconiux solani TaxID=661329 RepID=UPI000826F0C2|nr:YcnI family protein [Herbiconiux solani]